MGLYKRGTVWWMSFAHHGKRFRRSTETEDKKLAIRIFDKLKGELAEDKWFESLEGEKITFSEMLDKYMVEYSAINKAPRSHERDKGLRKHLEPVFGKIVLTDITPRQINEYKVQRRQEGASPRTVNYELIMMGHAFNLALREWEWVKENPVRKVRKEKVNNFIERWLTLEEEAKLVKASPKWLQEIIVFAIHTGFRESEILDLTWKQVDFNRRTITLYEQKNGGIDTLPINQTALQVLKERYESTGGASLRVFLNECGERIFAQNLIRSFHGAIKRAGIERLRFHDLRHTFATRLVQNGVDLYRVQKLGRWKTTSMIMRYAHHYPESLRPGIETMDRGFPEIITNLSQSPKSKGSRPLLRLVTP